MNAGSDPLKAKEATGLILNVNDDEGNRTLVSEILRRAGFTIHEAENGKKALEIATSRIDVVVLDVNLPDIDGFEVCRRLKSAAETASLPVLLLSAASVHVSDRVSGLEEGADGYLTLPLEPRELVAVVRSLLRLRQAEQARARETRRAMLAADLVVTLNDAQLLIDDLRRCASAFIQRLAVDAVGIWLPAPEEKRYLIAASCFATDVSPDGLCKEASLDGPSPSAESFDRQRLSDTAALIEMRGADSDWIQNEQMLSGVSYPLVVEGRAVGLLEIYSRSLSEAELLNAVVGPAETLALGIQRKQTSHALRAAEEISQRRQDRVRELERELKDLEGLARQSSTIVTSRAYGNLSLRESNAKAFDELIEQFRTTMELGLEQQSHRVNHQLPDRLRELGDRLGFLRAGPRDIIDIYSTTLKQITANATEQKVRAFVEEGRLLVLELMGNVLSYYRATSIGAIRTVSTERSKRESPKGAGDE